jgi:orotate phosphoribosyltransferase
MERLLLEQKNYGIKQRVEGSIYSGQDVLLGDDVISTAKTKLEGVEMLNSLDLRCIGSCVMFDRQEGGVEEMLGHNLPTHSVTTLSRVAGILQANGLIGSQQIEALEEYHAGLRQSGFTSNEVQLFGLKLMVSIAECDQLASWCKCFIAVGQ